jgi:hypothetical protein
MWEGSDGDILFDRIVAIKLGQLEVVWMDVEIYWSLVLEERCLKAIKYFNEE